MRIVREHAGGEDGWLVSEAHGSGGEEDEGEGTDEEGGTGYLEVEPIPLIRHGFVLFRKRHFLNSICGSRKRIRRKLKYELSHTVQSIQPIKKRS